MVSMHSEDYFALCNQQQELSHNHLLEKIPKLIYNDYRRPFASVADRYELPEKCTVCCKDFAHGQILRLLTKCNHTFHMLCVDHLLKYTKYKCPLCGNQGIEVKSYDDEID